MPCVFIPFMNKDINNIYTLYKEKKGLFEVLKTPLFVKIREWQEEYAREHENWEMPCPIRDNAKKFEQIINETGAIPLDKEAASYLNLCQPRGYMCKYNKECRHYLDHDWKTNYLKE